MRCCPVSFECWSVKMRRDTLRACYALALTHALGRPGREAMVAGFCRLCATDGGVRQALGDVGGVTSARAAVAEAEAWGRWAGAGGQGPGKRAAPDGRPPPPPLELRRGSFKFAGAS